MGLGGAAVVLQWAKVRINSREIARRGSSDRGAGRALDQVVTRGVDGAVEISAVPSSVLLAMIVLPTVNVCDSECAK